MKKKINEKENNYLFNYFIINDFDYSLFSLKNRNVTIFFIKCFIK